MAKKTNLPPGFTTKGNYQILPQVPANQKLNATDEWNSGIQDLADSIDANYERLLLNWINDILDNYVIEIGQYIDFEDEHYRCIESYNVSTPKTFDPVKFQKIGGGFILANGSGTTANDNAVDLGGNLSNQATTIKKQNDQTFEIRSQDGNNGEQQQLILSNSELWLHYGSTIGDINVQIGAEKSGAGVPLGGGLYLYAQEKALAVLSAGIVFGAKDGIIKVGDVFGTGKANHMQYDSDYSAKIAALDQAVKDLVIPPVKTVQAMINASGGEGLHTYTQLLYVDFVNGLDTNTGQYNTPLKTLQKALDIRVEAANVDTDYSIQVLSTGAINSITYDGTNVTGRTYIDGIASDVINKDNLTSWIVTLNVTNSSPYFYISNIVTLDINYTQSGTNYCMVKTQGGSPYGYLTIISADDIDRIYYFLLNANYTLYTVNCDVHIVLQNNSSITFNWQVNDYYIRKLTARQLAVLEIGNSNIITVDDANMVNCVVKLYDNSGLIINSGLFDPFSVVDKLSNSIVDLDPSVEIHYPDSLYHKFSPGTSGIVATNVEDAIKEAYMNGGSIEAKSNPWAWSDGVDVGGTHLDFIIPGVISDGEIGSLGSSILFVGSALQTNNFTIETTNFANDTIRLEGTINEWSPSIEVVLSYHKF